MKYKLSLILFLFSFAFAKAQKTMPECEKIAKEANLKISNLSLANINTINDILKNWELNCGENEVIARLKILLLIDNYQNFDKIGKRYLENYADNYFGRIVNSESDFHNFIYESDKKKFNYIALNSKLDKWIIKNAGNIIDNKALTQTEYLFCLLFTGNLDAFDRQLSTREYKNHYARQIMEERMIKQWHEEKYWTITGGTWIPLFKMNQHLNMSPKFGFELGGSLKNNFRIDAFFNFAPQIKPDSIEVRVDELYYLTKPKTVISLGLKFTKEYRLTNYIFSEVLMSLAYSGINTDLVKYINIDGDEVYYTMSTLDLGIGSNLNFRVGNGSIGLNIVYHYSPTKLDKRLVTNLGDQYLDLGIIVRF